MMLKRSTLICSAFELSVSTPWLRGVAKQKLEEEVRIEDSGRISKIRFRPFGVVRKCDKSDLLR